MFLFNNKCQPVKKLAQITPKLHTSRCYFRIGKHIWENSRRNVSLETFLPENARTKCLFPKKYK